MLKGMESAVSLPNSVRSPLLAEQRQKQLLAYVAHHRSAQVSELSSVFGVSMSTVRRDLQEMEERELVRRVHGGVLLASDRPPVQEPKIVQRSHANAEQKRRIGQAAAALVRDTSVIIITGGTTTEAMIPYLAEKAGLTVLTNALNIAQALIPYESIDVIVLGGWLRHVESTLLGHLTTQALQDVRADQIFYGIFGIDAETGLTGTFIREVQTDRALIAAARDLIVLADHSKFGRNGPARVLPIDAASRLITDRDAPDAEVQALAARGVAVTRV